MKHGLLGVLSLIILLSCQKSSHKDTSSIIFENIELKYATGFSIRKAPEVYEVTIKTPFEGAKDPLRYIFYKNSKVITGIHADAKVKIPVETIVCTSTTHIPLLDYLNETGSLTGFPTLDYISSPAMRQRIDNNEVEELGIDDALNIEKLIKLNPNVVLAYSLTGDMGQFSLIKEAGIPVIMNAEYLEEHPLGRAEWIKLAGILFGKEARADSVFNKIEQEYLQTKALAEQLTPASVLSGVVYGDSWYLPGGRNYASQLLTDAGYTYFWASDTTSGFLPLSFETVFEEAHEAEYWIGVASYNSREEMAAADSRYAEFAAFRSGNVYSYNKRIGAKGGSEFLELGYLRPDLILKDLVWIAHPQALPGHDLFFHFKLP